jgi:hypothetical protein
MLLSLPMVVKVYSLPSNASDTDKFLPQPEILNALSYRMDEGSDEPTPVEEDVPKTKKGKKRASRTDGGTQVKSKDKKPKKSGKSDEGPNTDRQSASTTESQIMDRHSCELTVASRGNAGHSGVMDNDVVSQPDIERTDGSSSLKRKAEEIPDGEPRAKMTLNPTTGRKSSESSQDDIHRGTQFLSSQTITSNSPYVRHGSYLHICGFGTTAPSTSCKGFCQVIYII